MSIDAMLYQSEIEKERIIDMMTQARIAKTAQEVRIATAMKEHNEKFQPLGGKKFDDNKPRMDLLPFDALEEIAKVLEAGQKKYEKDNWRKGFDYSRLVGATLRHLGAWNNGQDVDEETGVSHLAHAATNLMFLISLGKEGTGNDDRYILEKYKKASE